MNFETINVIITVITTLVTIVIMPLILFKLNSQHDYNKKVGMERLYLEEAEYKLNKVTRALTKESARAIKNKKSNGELTKAIHDLEIAERVLEEQKDKALKKLKDDYK